MKIFSKVKVALIMAIVMLVAPALSRKDRFVKSFYTLQRKGIIQLTKFHFYDRGKIIIHSKLSKKLKDEGTFKVRYLLYKRVIWDKIDKKKTCLERSLYAFRTIDTTLSLNGDTKR